MNKSIISKIIVSVIFCLAFAIWVKPQSSTTYFAEGVIVAFQKNMRCPTCESSAGSLAMGIENWIVKIDNWNGKKLEKNKYVLVEYQMYDRSLTESEIDKNLKFVLRNRMEHEKGNDCLNRVSIKTGENYFLRPVEFDDYELTEPGKISDIPKDFKKLPCFIINSLPETLE